MVPVVISAALRPTCFQKGILLTAAPGTVAPERIRMMDNWVFKLMLQRHHRALPV